MEWLEWVKIRGPIGGPRMDYYFTTLCMLIATLNPNAKEINPEDYAPQWLKVGESSGIDFITPWIDRYGGDEEE